MKYDPNKHHRQSIRLKGYDYASTGAYFITICAYQRECFFGEIVDEVMCLNEFGEIVASEWLKSAGIRQEIILDEYVVMPNHIHGIVFIQPVKFRNSVGVNPNSVGLNPNGVGLNPNGVGLNPNGVGLNPNGVGLNPNGVGANGRSPLQGVIPQMKPRSISSFMAGFKSATTKHINLKRNMPRVPVWQRNYYEHIIRNQESLQKLRQYIYDNPLSWNTDQLHPHNPSKW